MEGTQLKLFSNSAEAVEFDTNQNAIFVFTQSPPVPPLNRPNMRARQKNDVAAAEAEER